MALVDGLFTVTTAGTRQQFTTTSTPVRWIAFHALIASTGTIVVGASTVVAADATRRGVCVPEPGAAGSGANNPLMLMGPLDAADIWLDATVSGEKVSWLYQKM